MTTVLQISDTHIVGPGQVVSGRLDTASSLERLVRRIAAKASQLGQIDAILLSGDLSDDGTAQSYVHLKSLMAPLDVPLYVIPGNHDARDQMRQAFDDHVYLPATGRLNWHQRIGDIDMIGLDTLVEGAGAGVLDRDTLAFLDTALTAAQSRPVLLALHHPPFPSGIAFMDRIGLAGRDALTTLLQDFDTDIRVVCGHIHTTMVASVGGKIALSCPSPCSSFEFDLTPDAPVGFMDHGDGAMVHRWQDGFQSIRIPIDTGSGPFPF
ncbi:MAG: phosphodiesterase [Roseovarius sp.]